MEDRMQKGSRDLPDTTTEDMVYGLALAVDSIVGLLEADDPDIRKNLSAKLQELRDSCDRPELSGAISFFDEMLGH